MATKTNIERPNRSCIGKLLNDQRANRQGARKLRQKSDAPQSTSPHGEERGAAARLEPWPGTPKLGRNAMLAVRTLRFAHPTIPPVGCAKARVPRRAHAFPLHGHRFETTRVG